MAIVDILQLILNFYVVIYIAYNLNNMKLKINIKNLITVTLTSIFYYYLLKISFINDFKLLLTFIILIIILKITLEISLFKILETTIFTIILVTISESLLALVFNIPYFISKNELIRSMMYLLIYANDFFLLFLRNRLSKILKCKINITESDMITNIFILSIALIIIFSYFLVYEYSIKYLNNTLVMILSIFSFLYIIIILTFTCINQTSIKNIEKLNETKENYKQLKLYSDITEYLVEDVTKFRHDYKNIVFMMNGYIENNDYDGLKEYFNKNLLPKGELDEISKLKRIKNSGLKGLLAGKISIMQKQNITVSLNILNDIKDFYIDTLDLCRIIGIFLDNAMEASMESTEKFISICFINDSNGINITILNSCDSEIRLSEIYKKGYSTKGNSRGIGLCNVQDIIIERYENVLLNTSIEADTFIQDIYIAK